MNDLYIYTYKHPSFCKKKFIFYCHYIFIFSNQIDDLNCEFPLSWCKSETYGEDIANTETEESDQNTDEDKYEGSFIDDDELEVFSRSPVSSDQGRLSIFHTAISHAKSA